MMEQKRALLLTRDQAFASITEAALRRMDFVVTVLSGVRGGERESLQSADIIIFDTALDGITLTDVVAIVAEKFGSARLIAAVQSNQTDEFAAVLSAGAVAYITKPADAIEVLQTVRRALTMSAPANVSAPEVAATMDNPGRIISVFSSVGGIGVTTIAVNLAVSLSQHYNKKTCMVDADLQFGDTARYLGIDGVATLAEYARAGFKERQTPSVTGKLPLLDVLGGAGTPIEAMGLAPTVIETALDRLQNRYEYIVVDTALGFSPANIAVLKRSSLILFVGVLDYIPTVKNLRLALDSLDNIGIPREQVKLILNRSKAKSVANTSQAEEILNRKFDVAIPNQFQEAVEAVKTSSPFAMRHGGELPEAIHKLAGSLIFGKEEKLVEETGFFSRLSRWLKR